MVEISTYKITGRTVLLGQAGPLRMAFIALQTKRQGGCKRLGGRELEPLASLTHSLALVQGSGCIQLSSCLPDLH